MNTEEIISRCSDASGDFSSPLNSIRRSRLDNDSSEPAADIRPSLESYFSFNEECTTLEKLFSVIKSCQLPGPANIEGSRKYIGTGSQFMVYSDTLYWTNASGINHRLVAVKFPKVDLQPNVRINHARPEDRRHLQHVILEILALRDPALRAHPNIANLNGYAVDCRRYHQPLGLVMDLADHTLADYLEKHAGELDMTTKYWMCHDVASGLDMLHEKGLVHGDLKPGNILLYQERGRFVAKISDFGASVEATANTEDKEARRQLLGTLGWQAPEVEADEWLKADELYLADNYSFGLLAWSIMLHAGKRPPRSSQESVQATAAREITECAHETEVDMESLARAVSSLLQTSSNRPLRVKELFDGLVKEEAQYLSPVEVPTSGNENKLRSSQTTMRNFPWENPLFGGIFAAELYSRFQQNPKGITDDLLFSMFLQYTDPSRLSTAIDYKKAILDVLVASARQGYVPAQAIVPTILEFLDVETIPDVNRYIPEWLEKGVSSGSIIAGKRLQESDPQAFIRGRKKFRELGGYNQIHCAIDRSAGPLLGAPQNKDYSKLHWLATFGTIQDLKDYLSSEKDYDINLMTANEETPLYLACARGSWHITKTLLDHGANPSIKCTTSNISCMHWLFAFDTEFQALVATEFIRSGAEIDALVSSDVPFLHYPFVLPRGTPLHWAVATSSYESISVLISKGANVLFRNEVDPYVFDRRVRELHILDTSDLPLYSVSEIPNRGLSPLDLAAMQHDPFIFHNLLRLGKKIDINSSDEEGFSVLHRLSCNPQCRTRTGTIFSTLPFRGSVDESHKSLKQTISAIKDLGGNLEQLTTPSQHKAQASRGNYEKRNLPSYTPLMLAVFSLSPKVVGAMLDSGASVDMVNNLSETAIHCLPDCHDDEKPISGECVRLLISKKSNVNHKNARGTGPILRASWHGLLEAVEVMLSEGADIDERERNPKSRTVGMNMFGYIAQRCRPGSDDDDQVVARLLETHVFSCHDLEKRRRVIEVGDCNGSTLLHEFARISMPRCVQSLLANHAPVNARKKMSLTLLNVKSSWHETPLDVAVEVRASRFSKMTRFRNRSLDEYTKIEKQASDIIDMIVAAGGVSTRDEVV